MIKILRIGDSFHSKKLEHCLHVLSIAHIHFERRRCSLREKPSDSHVPKANYRTLFLLGGQQPNYGFDYAASKPNQDIKRAAR